MRLRPLLILAIASGLMAGCASDDAGAPVPKRAAISEDQIKTLPPEAQTAAANAAKAGDFQSQRMREMAEAQRRAQAGGGH
jgi:hypothetical protein